MSRQRSLIACAIAACIGTIPIAAAAAYAYLPAGTMVTATMNQTIDSGSAHVGDQFTAAVVPPYPGRNGIYAGAQLRGRITRVVRAGQGTNPTLEFTIDRIVLANGRSAAIAMLLQSQETQRHNNTGNVAIGAVAGMIIGNMVGKTLFKSNVGGAVGAIAGALYASNKRTNVSLRKGSTVVLEARYGATIN